MGTELQSTEMESWEFRRDPGSSWNGEHIDEKISSGGGGSTIARSCTPGHLCGLGGLSWVLVPGQGCRESRRPAGGALCTRPGAPGTRVGGPARGGRVVSQVSPDATPAAPQHPDRPPCTPPGCVTPIERPLSLNLSWGLRDETERGRGWDSM